MCAIALLLCSNIWGSYSLVDLGPYSATGLNDQGQVLLATQGPPGINARTYLRDSSGGLTRIGGAGVYGTGLSNSGEVAGVLYVPENRVILGGGRPAIITNHAFSTLAGVIVDHGEFLGGATTVEGANSSGNFVGQTDNGGAPGPTYVYRNGAYEMLHGNPLDASQASGINDSQIIVGSVKQKATLWRLDKAGNQYMEDSIYEDLPEHAQLGESSYATEINNHNQVIGTIQYLEPYAFMWEDGKNRHLGSFHAEDLNTNGWVVGFADGAGSNATRYAVLHDGLAMLDLSSLTNSDWTLETAIAINSTGQIVGWGYNSDEELRSYLLNPVSVPTPGAIMLALVGVGTLRFGRKCNV